MYCMDVSMSKVKRGRVSRSTGTKIRKVVRIGTRAGNEFGWGGGRIRAD